MTMLYTGGRIGNLELKNRWVMLAMHTGYAEPDGRFGKRDMDFYSRRADGGMAAITLVAAVNGEGSAKNMHRLDKDIYDEGIRQICDLIHSQNCKVIMHLFHAGRNKKKTKDLDGKSLYPLAPSPIPSPIYKMCPKEMTEQQIAATIDDYASAAKRCRDNGVDCIEVSASAGYLLSEFMSLLTNKRTDIWGGNLDNRLRFPRRVLMAIRNEVGADYPVILKISAGDMLGGYNIEDMIYFINNLPPGTIDGVTVTGGWHEAPVPQMTYHVPPAGFAGFASKVRRDTGLPVIACNRINSPEIAEHVLQQGYADFVGAARPFLADPHFAIKGEAGEPYLPCQACNKGCIERVIKGKDCLCAFNPETGRESIQKVPDDEKKHILVIGSGPSGMVTAKYESEKGNKVTLVTEEKELGGKLKVAAKPPYKSRINEYIRYLSYEMIKNKVRLMRGVQADEAVIQCLKPDKIYVATGSSPKAPQIKGLDNICCFFAEEVLKGDKDVSGHKDIVILGGGSVGLETAEYLAASDKRRNITVIEATEKAGQDLGGTRWITMGNLKAAGVEVIKSTTIKYCEAERIVIAGPDGEKTLPADVLILAVGAEPLRPNGLELFLKKQGIPYIIVGDAFSPRNIMTDLAEVFFAVNNLNEVDDND